MKAPLVVLTPLLLIVTMGLSAGCGTGDKEKAMETPTDSVVHQGSSASAVKTYTFHGTPTKIDSANNMITIDHEAIEGYMEAMTMPYKVADPAILHQVKIGQETHFTLRVSGDQALIVKVEEGHDD